MTATSFYMHLDVRGALNNMQRSRAKKSAFTDDQGRPITRLEAIDGLMDELAKGHECMPMSKGCGKPCKNSPLCTGFDYGENGGCPGYPVTDEPRP